LAKTNQKYIWAKQAGFGESDEAEGIAAGKMRALADNNEALLRDSSFASHYQTQRLDREAHLAETGSGNNRYGPFTSALTNLVPVMPRAMYSYATARLPTMEEASKWWDE
jgi:hypothetical protein